MKQIFLIAIIAGFGFLQTSCGGNEKKGKEEEAAHDHEHGEEEGNTATLTAEQIKSIGIVMGPIEQKQLTASLKANGVLRVPNQNKALVNSLYSGVIKNLLVEPGGNIARGQVIATITNPQFVQVQEEYLSVNARIALAEQEYNRQKELNEGNAGALKNLQSAESELRTSRARKASLQQQIRLMGIDPATVSDGRLVTELSLRSPISGVVSNVAVKMGTYVDVTSAVAEIVDNSQLHLDLFVYEKDLPKLRNKQLIHFTLTNNPGKEYDAEIFSLGSSFENESKAVSVHAKVMGDKTGLIDGMNITALVSLDKITTPAVPSDAIVTWQGRDYIFMVKEEAHDGAAQEGHSHAEGAHDHDHGNTAHAHDHKDDGHDHGEVGHNHDHKDDGHDHGKVTGSNVQKEEKKAAPGSVSFEKIPVAKGTSEVGYTQITLLKEIPVNARIVTKGAFFVLAKMTNAGDHGHAH